MASSTFITFNYRGLDAAALLFGPKGQRAVDRAVRSTLTFTAKDYTKDKFKRISQDIDRPAPFTRNPRVYNWDGANKSGPPVARAYVNTRQSEYLRLVETGGTRTATPGHGRPMNPKPGIADKFGGLYGAKGIKRKFLDRSTPGIAGAGPNGRTKYARGAKRYFVGTLDLPGSGRTYGLYVRQKVGVAEKRKRKKINQFGQSSIGVPLGTIRKRNKQAPGTFAGSNQFKNAGWKTRLLVRFDDTGEYQPQLGFGRDAVLFARRTMGPTFERVLRRELDKLRTS